MCEVITNTDFEVTIPESNYIKKWVLTDLNPHTFQGLIDPVTSQYNGMGRIKYLNPSNQIQTYIGTFLQGDLTGSGTIWYADGTIYKGQVTNGKRHGHGTMYGPNGKFQYDGVWANDFIDKPIYKTVVNSSGQIESQGFQVNGEYKGWVVIHSDGQISQIQFYQNNKAIKGFGKSGINYMINYSETSSFSNQQAYDFLFQELVKLNKPEQLQQFLSNETNIKMLEEFSFDYDSDTGGYKQYQTHKLFNDKGLYEIYQSNPEVIVRNTNNYSSPASSTSTAYSTNFFVQTLDTSNEKIQGSLWLIRENKINNVKLIKQDDGSYGLEEFDCVAKGDFSLNEGVYELNGQGWLKNGSKTYTGIFISNKITEGQEISNGNKIYEGKFNSSGKYHGIGTEWTSTGKLKYQGDFSNGKYHGNGSSYYINAETESIEYVGQWFNGYKHAQGTLFSISGDEIYTGLFDHDQIA